MRILKTLGAISAQLLFSQMLFAQAGPQGPDESLLRSYLTRHKANAASFSFAAIGDQQYGAAGIAKWPALQGSINAEASTVKFVVHTGDIKSGSTVCDDAMFQNRRQSFDAFEMPMILTPGDNEWTDCHRANNGSFDSLERLAYLRNIFYPNNLSMGKRTIQLTQQSEDRRYAKYVENSMWSEGNVLFATLHVIGSNNNRGRNEVNDAEYRERTHANFNWLKTVFSVARDGQFGGVVIVMQANPGFNGSRVRLTGLEEGFQDTFFVLEDEVITLNKPVLLIHGDSHEFHFDKPLLGLKSGLPLDNLTRLEVPGAGDVHWIKVTVNPARKSLFSIEYVDVAENFFAQQKP
ncbi:MAG: hypothetical protein NW208_17025 [Bryobacter sp.]|nr:hypothetical protein [Bryobacter sp.]